MRCRLRTRNERSGHCAVLCGHEPISALQPTEDLDPITVRSQTCATIVFGVHCGALAKREVDTVYFVLCRFETGADYGDPTLIAVPETKMYADFSEALKTDLAAWRSIERFVILL